MRTNLILLTWVLHFIAWSILSSAQNRPLPDQVVSGTGCVNAGVESRCLVLRDRQTGKLYNLFFTGVKPAIGSAIDFSGVATQGVTYCMQGEPVRVKQWNASKIQCSVAEKGRD